MIQTLKKLAIAAAVAGVCATAQAAPVLKFGHVDGADWQASKKGAAGVIFKNTVEGETDLTVELYPAKALGDEGDLDQ